MVLGWIRVRVPEKPAPARSPLKRYFGSTVCARRASTLHRNGEPVHERAALRARTS